MSLLVKAHSDRFPQTIHLSYHGGSHYASAITLDNRRPAEAALERLRAGQGTCCDLAFLPNNLTREPSAVLPIGMQNGASSSVDAAFASMALGNDVPDSAVAAMAEAAALSRLTDDEAAAGGGSEIDTVMAFTACSRDEAERALAENFFDIDAAVQMLLALQFSKADSDNSAASASSSDAKAKKKPPKTAKKKTAEELLEKAQAKAPPKKMSNKERHAAKRAEKENVKGSKQTTPTAAFEVEEWQPDDDDNNNAAEALTVPDLGSMAI